MGNGLSSASIIDVSTAGFRVSINGHPIQDFMDDSNPVEFQDIDVAKIQYSCNGRMIRTIQPASVLMSVTVIPGSGSYSFLWGLWKDSFINGAEVALDKADQELSADLFWNCGNKTVHINYRGGTCIGGPGGLNAGGNGKMGGATFTFAFANLN